MAHTIKIGIRQSALLSLALAAGIAQAQPSIPVGLYVDCAQPTQLKMAFRNRGGEFTTPSGLLPWNSIFSMRIRAFSITKGKIAPLALYAPIADHMKKTKVLANEVASGQLNLSDVIKDFESIIAQGDIVVTYSQSTNKIAQTPSFTTRPTVVIIPRQTPSSKGCPLATPIGG